MWLRWTDDASRYGEWRLPDVRMPTWNCALGSDWAGETVKRSELVRKTPMKPGTKPLQARAPMARGQSRMRASKPKADKPKRAARNAGPDYLAMCRGQTCYLLMPGVLAHPINTVVPAHSNQIRHGKGMGMKALDVYTVPACSACHAELDQGMRFTKEEKFALWDAAYEKWEADRKLL